MLDSIMMGAMWLDCADASVLCPTTCIHTVTTMDVNT